MDHHAFPSEDDSPDIIALMLAALVHLLLIAALFFGVQWRSKAPTAIAVEVWRSAAPLAAPPPAPELKPEPLPEPPPPKAEPKPEPKPVPKVETPVKPDIAIKEEKKPKKEEPKKPEPKPEPKKEEPKKPDPKPEPKKEEPKKPEPRPEPKKQEPERRNFDDALAQEMKQVQQQKTAHAQRASAEAELGRMIGERESAANERGRADYAAKIRGAIRGHMVLPPSIKGNPEAVFKVKQLPTGDILDVKLAKSTGNRALDEAIERAIRKSDPLPLPDQPGLFQRELELKYKPFDD